MYVDADATGANDGSSWQDAYTSVFVALQGAQAGDDLWIAEGEYPSVAANAPVAILSTCVDLYGGFVGTEVSVDERPDPLPLTTLDGDFNDDDETVGVADNAFRVVVADGVDDVLLDGLTITGGNGTGGGDSNNGGGIYSLSSSLTLANVTLTGNYAFNGGALHADASETTILGGSIADNGGNAAGLEIVNGSNVVIDGASLTSNIGSAGAVRAVESDLSVHNATFTDNESTSGISTGGGGAINATATNVVIYGSVFQGNSGNHGGAIRMFDENFSLDITGSDFIENSSPGWGGAIRVDGPASFSNVWFSGNSADLGGALDASSNLLLDTATFENNAALIYAGAIRHSGGSLQVSPLRGASSYAAPQWCSGQVWQQRSGTGRMSEGSGQRGGERVA